MTAGGTTSPARGALALDVRGVVQGVGFRPFIHRLALRNGLTGWVRNESGTVHIEVEGGPEDLDRFVREVDQRAPPLARIDSVEVRVRAPSGAPDFRIAQSATQRDRRQPVSPDVATCDACERELFDPTNRRYGYPFITCTDCGPRFTVIESMPYDRERTSMRAFRQCPTCRREYTDPSDRRYHSETNSCPACGPSLTLVLGDSSDSSTRELTPLVAAARLLIDGRIVALRGLGGFHLAVDATNEAAVRTLRVHKQRAAKPLAVMVHTVADARRLAQVSPEEERLLMSPERPIVLLECRPDASLASSVAPRLGWVGVMTAYTPLHHLLLDLVGRPLVMTSGNLSEEPIAIANDDARHRLGGVADAFLLHDREIVARYDDSVVRVVEGEPVHLRRARGYAPLPIPLPWETPVALVAAGAHLKNTFTLAHGRSAYVSQHVGDLENLETLEHFQASLAMYRRLFSVDPEVAVRDLHPGYLSTRMAEELGLGRVMAVQHHHAHVAAVAAEHGVTDPVIGVAYDGTGYGDDGCVWGAEVMVADLVAYRRVGHLRYAPLPGGDLAARQPWRAALGYLSLAPEVEHGFRPAWRGVGETELRVASSQLERRLNAPLASSMGRLFDAAAAVLGVRRTSHYEGQAAMELEALAGRRPGRVLPIPIREDEGGGWILDPVPLLATLGERSLDGVDARDLSAAFHESVAHATAVLVERVADSWGVGVAVLGGGVFQNARLLASLRRRLVERGLRVLLPRALSPNDGAISYGQAVVAAAVLRREGGC